MGNVFFTSDLHVSHRLVSAARGFAGPDGGPDIDAHDHAVLGNWARTVGRDDTVWVLGDLAATSNPERVGSVLAMIATLPGTKHLIAGNHDPVHPMHRKAHKWQRRYLEVFESVQAFARRKIVGQGVLLSHFPYGADHTEKTRYDQYRLPNQHSWLIHGHTHSTEKRTGPREIHVGLDAWDLKPVPLEELEKIITES